MSIHKTYTKDQVVAATLDYFFGDSLQTDVFVEKYALKDTNGNYYELTPADMHRRLAKEFARIEARYPNPLSEDEIYDYLENARTIGPQGSPMFGIGNDFQLVSTSNCAVIASPNDTMSSILETARDLSNLYKRRFGAGVDISTLRPEGSPVNNAARSSTGAWSFADLFSYVTRMVGQAGRRGALLISMDVRHPDIEKFITMKKDLTKVTGANISVKVSDEFMRAVENDEPFVLRFPIDAEITLRREGDNWVVDAPPGVVTKVVRAKDIFHLIAETAAQTAEPGLLFWDTATNNLPLHCYPGFEAVTTNPCGEIILSPYDSCRLISLYLAPFVKNEFTNRAEFDFDRFRETVRVAMRLSDDLVDLELEKLIAIRDLADTQDEKELFTKFIDACFYGRRTGLGTHGLADTLARLRIRYDSDEAVALVEKIYRTLKLAAYKESVNLAKERGPFPVWDWNKEKDCEFFQRMASESEEGATIVEEMSRVGRRNGSILTNAPTGSRSILSENCSSGIEPVFRNQYRRRRKVDTPADYTDITGDHWQEYTVFHKNVERYYRHLQKTEPVKYAGLTVEQIAEKVTLPDYFVTSDQIDWRKRVEIQAVITRNIDHSVSSTLNLPRGTTGDTVEQIYLEAWRLGCKGVTVYVDGSRDAQVLESIDNSPKKVPNVPYIERGTNTVGKMTKAAFIDSFGNERKVYVYRGWNDTGEMAEVFLKDELGGPDNAAYASALGRLISLLLKHKVKPEEIANKLIGLRGDSQCFLNGIYTSVPDFVGKLMLGRLDEPKAPSVAPVATTGRSPDKCVSCGGDLTKAEGCVQCLSCGWSKCS